MIPGELKTKKNWVGFTLPGKIPMNPSTGVAAQSNDSTTWAEYGSAQNAVIKHNWAGVGFMLESPYVGIDLDDCVKDGVINDYAMGILKKCNSYAEFSPSKTGVHIICKGSIPRAVKTPTLEIYCEKRYFTMTGDVIRPYTTIRKVDLSFLLGDVSNTSVKPFEERLKEMQEGNRNNNFTSLAGSLRAKGYSAEGIFELLRAKAKEVNFEEKELWIICQSVGRYAPGNQTTEVPTEVSSSIEDFLNDVQAVEWIVPGLVAKQSVGFVAGLPESRKTWLLMDLAVEAARGGVWLGRFPVKKAKVLFVDQERFKGETQRRLKAVLTAKSLDGRELKGNLFVRCGTTTRLNLQHSFDAFRKELSELKPDVVIVDSFATFHTAEENNRKDIQDVLERVKQLRNEFGCTFIFISHENKFAFNRGEESNEPSIAEMAGSVAIPAAAEFVFTVRKQDSESSMVFNTKNTLASSCAPFLIKVVDVSDTKIEVRAF